MWVWHEIVVRTILNFFPFLAAKKWEGGINLHDLDLGQTMEGASAHFFYSYIV